MTKIFTLNAKQKNRHNWVYDDNLTGYQVIFRLKQYVEDITIPLIEVLATHSYNATTSLEEGYFDIDLTGTDYSGKYFFEIEINDAVSINATPTTPPLFNQTPTACLIQTRLDN
jgi:hypothetical protein